MNRWDSDAFDTPEISKQILADLKGSGLGYIFHPLYGWRPKPNVKLQTVSTNEFRLRSRSFSTLTEHKCFIIGGSFGWGYGASSNEYTPSYLLENYLKQAKKDISVINLAEQMFASPQQIQSFVFSVDELKPKYVICITGYNDISQGFRNRFKNNGQFRKYDSFLSWGNQCGIISKESNLKKLAKIVYHHNASFEDPYKNGFTYSKPSQEEIPLTLISNTINHIESYCLNNGIKAAFVLEPLVYSKKFKTEAEKSILKYVGKEKQEYFEEQKNLLKAKIWGTRDNSIFIDSGEFFENEEQTIFFDDIHMSDRGYKIWTEKLYDELNKNNFFEKNNG